MNRAAFACVLLPVIFSGCFIAAAPNQVGISKVPVMKGAKLFENESMGVLVGESLNAMDEVTTQWWSFEIDATHDEILAFYKQQYPNAEIDSVPAYDDEPAYTEFWLDTNNKKIDELTITITDGEFTISESTLD